jgi:hypothetical protein
VKLTLVRPHLGPTSLQTVYLPLPVSNRGSEGRECLVRCVERRGDQCQPAPCTSAEYPLEKIIYRCTLIYSLALRVDMVGHLIGGEGLGTTCLGIRAWHSAAGAGRGLMRLQLATQHRIPTLHSIKTRTIQSIISNTRYTPHRAGVVHLRALRTLS